MNRWNPLCGVALASFLAAALIAVPGARALAQKEQGKSAKSAGKSAAKPEAKAAAKPDAKKADAESAKATEGKSGEGGQLKLADFGDWGVYTGQRGKSKVCYVMTQPTSREPKNLIRDPAYLFVSSQPSEKVNSEISVVMGFPAKEGAEATAVVGQSNFALITKNSEATKLAEAWLKNPAEGGRVLAALSRADKLLIKSESKKGNKLTDEYSLKGFSEALERLGKECPGPKDSRS